MGERYPTHAAEPRWRAAWQQAALDQVDLEAARRPFYSLVEFPYPSGEGLHVGHVYTYCGADALGRLRRMQGYDVFQPFGFDAFGIHSENYALKLGAHPAALVPANIERFTEQVQRLGCMFDWSRSVDTTEPAYYRWTQWIFVQLFRAGLAYQAEAPVNWCPRDQTVLANEQVVDGRCERCDTPVERRVMRQWFLRMTAYADRLLDFSRVSFPESLVRRQQAWIGRREGVDIDFQPADSPAGAAPIVVFTTRPETIFGATFVALAPEHPRAVELATPERREAVAAYVARARNRAERERAAAPPGSGIFTGAHLLNPATGAALPVWVADYVLAGVGSGAVMGVPAHDERDAVFAASNDLPVVRVVGGSDTLPYSGEGALQGSGSFDGMPSEQARPAIGGWLAGRGVARPAVSYRLRDWLISRQRYWGPPIPIIHCGACGPQPVPEEELPVLLPHVEEFRPTGVAPLAAVPEFVAAACPRCGGPGRRETDVSDNFLDSAWYFLRYPSTECHDRAWDAARTARWLPVDHYAGGPEHATMHHLYARFIVKALHDLGHLSFDEPFERLRVHGTITRDGAKMSKSRGNVVSPDGYVAAYGADVTRMYMLFLGPWEEGGDFSDAGIGGVARFVARVWDVLAGPPPSFAPDESLAAEGERRRHALIARVTDGIESLRFHVAIAALMEQLAWLRDHGAGLGEAAWQRWAHTFALLLAPLAPHLAEELWSRQGQPFSVHRQPWPIHDAALLAAAQVTLPVQVGGRVRDRVVVAADAAEEEIVAAALASERVRGALGGAQPRRIVVVPGKIVSLLA